MFFEVTYSAIYTWKGFGTDREQRKPNIWDSFCHLIIAREHKTDASWIIMIDQGEDSGTSITNCAEYLVPRICEEFALKPSELRAFEILPHHEDPRLKYTEIADTTFCLNHNGDFRLQNISWNNSLTQLGIRLSGKPTPDRPRPTIHLLGGNQPKSPPLGAGRRKPEWDLH